MLQCKSCRFVTAWDEKMKTETSVHYLRSETCKIGKSRKAEEKYFLTTGDMMPDLQIEKGVLLQNERRNPS